MVYHTIWHLYNSKNTEILPLSLYYIYKIRLCLKSPHSFGVDFITSTELYRFDFDHTSMDNWQNFYIYKYSSFAVIIY